MSSEVVNDETESAANMQSETLVAASHAVPAPPPWAPPTPLTPLTQMAPDGVSRSRADRWWAVPLAALGGVLVAAPLIAALVTVDRYSTAPGDASPVNRIVEKLPVTSYEPKGDILFVTVSSSKGEVDALTAFEGWIDPDVRFDTRKARYGDRDPETERLRAFQQMQKAKETAPYVALTKLGYPTSLTEGDVIIDYVQCFEGQPGSCTKSVPADEVLNAGDQILEANGTPIATGEQLRDVMLKVAPGDQVTLKIVQLDQKTLERAKEPKIVKATTIASPDDPKRAIFAIVLADTREPKLPFDIGLRTDQVGGPSAGLAFTLTLIDELTPGELTGGQKIAVTGTIDFEQNVGAIGGLPQKAVAVKQAGAQYFLVPAAQSKKDLAAAERVLGKGHVFPVATVDEALDVLARLGGNAASIGTPGKGYTG